MEDPMDVMMAALALIKRHERFSQFPARDRSNTLEIGYGTNLMRRGLTEPEADQMARNDIIRLHGWLSSFPFFERLTLTRKAVLIDMAYELGEDGLAHFGRTLAYLDLGAYEKAADEMLKSDWAQQVPTRASDDADLMRKG